MIWVHHRDKLRYLFSSRNHFMHHPSNASSSPLSRCIFSNLLVRLFSNLRDSKLHQTKSTKEPPSFPFHFSRVSSYSNALQRCLSTKPYYYPKKKNYKNSKSGQGAPPLNAPQIELILSQLTPRFNSEDFCNVLNRQEDPRACLELFSYASQQPRFRHDVFTYHATIKKLGAANLYEEMDSVADQVLAIPAIGSEALFNTIIYFYTEARRLSKAVHVFKHMRKGNDSSYRPSVRTYNLLFTAFLSRRSNTYINHMYMETSRCLFKQMVNDGIEPDIFSLNSMIKGYVLSLHINDALRIFHQMGVIYQCKPDSHSYDYLIHGLCCQGRTKNAKELYKEMKNKGFVPSGKAYNSLTNSLAIGGEIEEAVNILWEMNEKRRPVEFITYRTVLDEICRQKKVGDAMRLLKELQEKDLVDGHTYRKLLHLLEDDFEDSNDG